jgi:hypothetical protein
MNNKLLITVEQAKWLSKHKLFNSTPMFSYIKPISKDDFELVLGEKIVAGESIPALTLEELIAIVPNKLMCRFLHAFCLNDLKEITARNLATYIINSVNDHMCEIKDNLIQVIR